VALVLCVAGPGEEWRIFSTEEFKPPSNPATWLYLGQVFHVSSSTSASGEEVSVEMSLDLAVGETLTALKWELVFPAQLMEMGGGGPAIGSASLESGKSLKCVARTSRRDLSCRAGFAEQSQRLSDRRQDAGGGPAEHISIPFQISNEATSFDANLRF
jgi:hypothetical protein